MKVQSLVVVSGALLCLAACDVAPPPAAGPSAPPVQETRTVRPAGMSGTRDRQMAFLNRIREADPQHDTIERAMLNEENELGLILSRRVEMDKIPVLMRGMLTQMAKEFPGEDLSVHAYAPSDPPRKIGTARLNAQTRDMTYTPAN